MLFLVKIVSQRTIFCIFSSLKIHENPFWSADFVKLPTKYLRSETILLFLRTKFLKGNFQDAFVCLEKHLFFVTNWRNF